MVNTFARWGFGRKVAGLALMLVALIWFARGSDAQDEQPVTPERTRQAFDLGVNSHKAGDLETAEGYFQYVQAGQQHLPPAKVKELNEWRARNAAALNTKRDGAVQLVSAEAALEQGRMIEVATTLKALKINPYLSPAEKQRVEELAKRLQPQGKTDVKSLLAAGRAALSSGNLNDAEMYAAQAERANNALAALVQGFGDTPSKLRRDVVSARIKQEQAMMPPGLPKGEGPTEPVKSTSKFGMPVLWPFGSNSSAAKKDEQAINEKIARTIVADGYTFLGFNDLEKAKFLALKAKELPVTWNANEPTPDALLQEIERRTANPVAPLTNPTPKDGDPRTLLRLGRSLLKEKKFDEADKICNQVSQVRDARWGLFEDTPDKLRNDIKRIRSVSDREQSFKVMADARKLFTQGNLEEAEKACYRAKTLHGPYGVFDTGDRPDKLIDEIVRIRNSRNEPTKPADPQLAKKDTPAKNAPPGLPPEILNANKNKAMVLLRDAQQYEGQGMFVEARQKALEARTLQAKFETHEESPDTVLQRVLFKCDTQIQAYLQQTMVLLGQTADPQRFEKANACLAQARGIAKTFDLDGSRIDQAQYHMQQVASGAQPFNPNPPYNPNANFQTTGDPNRDAWLKAGREMLHHAQIELKEKRCATARKICLELRTQPAYGMQAEADRMMRSIGAEEENQRLIESRRTFDAGLDAFLAKDYRRALLLFNEIDPTKLPQHYQTRMRDIMSTREMQPSIMLVEHQASGQDLRGSHDFLPKHIKGEKIVTKETRGLGPDRDNVLEDWKSLQKVQVEQLQQQGVDVMRRANELFNRKDKADKEKAIDTLKQYVSQIDLAHLEPAKANQLKRMPESRMQQYRNMMQVDQLASYEKESRFPMKWDEPKFQREDAKLKEQIYEKMKVAHELMKQNKHKEAHVIVKQVRELDRENVAALAADRIITTRILQERENQDIASQENRVLNLLRNEAYEVPDMKNPLILPDKKYIAKHPRGGNGGIQYQLTDPKEKKIQYRLQQPISLNLKDRPLQQALQDITAISGVQVVPDVDALKTARVDLDAPLSINVEDIDMKSALTILLKPLKLSYAIEHQVLLITSDNTKGRLTRITYPIGDLVVAVEDHPMPEALDPLKQIEYMQRQMRNQMPGLIGPQMFPMGPGTPVSSHGNPSDPAAAFTQSSNQKRSKEQMADLLIGLIRGAVAKNSWDDMGGEGRIQYFPMGMALVINQSQEVQEEVQQLLQSLRRLQDLQVSVEMRAVLVSETFFERIGVDFDMNIRTPTSRREPDLVNGTFVPAPFVNRTADRLGGLISGLTSAGTLTPDLNIPVRNSTFNFTTPQFGGYQPEAGIQLGLAFLSDIQVFMFLEAVQGDRRAHIMQAPKITVYNGQQASINGTMLRPQVTGVIPTQLGNGQVVVMPNMSLIPFGLGMTVQPTVSPDRRFIRLNVQPIAAQGQQDPAAAQLIVVPGTVQGTLDGGGLSPAFVNNPLSVNIAPTTVNLTIVQTTVNVPDGGTVLLGGFRFLAEERTEYGPPVLSKIPYLSRLFRNVGWSRDGSTLVYLVTARVIMVEEEERLFLGELAPIPGR